MILIKKISTQINKIFVWILIFLISAIRPLFGFTGCCKFEVSCTQYAKQALHQFSWYKACWLILKRLLSCW